MISVSIGVAGLLVALSGFVQNESFVKRLSSADFQVRLKAVNELEEKTASDPTVLIDSTLQETLIALLEAENARVAENTAKFLKTGQNSLSERYAEYYAQVLGLVNSARKSSVLQSQGWVRRLRRALVFGVYNPDSAFVSDLAREGENIAPLILELSQSTSGPSRWNAYALIGQVFAHEDAGTLAGSLSPASAASLRSAARDALLDPAPDVRRWAVRAVSKAKDKAAIPMLERLAQSDPDAGPGKYSVRSLAAETLARWR